MTRHAARPPSRWLYVLPLCLLIAAGWAWNDQSQPADQLIPWGMSAQPGDALDTPLDPNDPRRFTESDGFVEDAATGLRLPAVAGLTPAEVFGASNEGNLAESDAVQPDYRNRAAAPYGSTGGSSWSSPGGQNVRAPVIQPVDDLRYGIGSRPSHLVVESIGVASDVKAIGIEPSRALRVPRRADVVGWWSGGSVPGETGPTVLVGHFDSPRAPGVFARLKDVKPGAVIVISQTDGAKYTYFVTEVQVLKKVAFPTQRVYGSTAESTLRLVTCGGKFDRRTGHYVDNTIVYADLLSVTPSRWATTVPLITEANPVSTDATSTVPTTATTSLSSVPNTITTSPVTTLPPASGAPSVATTLLPPTAPQTTVPASTVSASTVPVPTVPVPTVPVPTIPLPTVPDVSTTAEVVTIPVAPVGG